jgi:hypothetical protein
VWDTREVTGYQESTGFWHGCLHLGRRGTVCVEHRHLALISSCACLVSTCRESLLPFHFLKRSDVERKTAILRKAVWTLYAILGF